MKIRLRLFFLVSVPIVFAGFPGYAQELGPGFTKIKDGIYVFAPDATTTTCSFVVTQEGVVMIDSCNTPVDSRKMLATIKKVTDKPVVFLIDTETHSDHTANHFIFSPPATIISHEGAGENCPTGSARTPEPLTTLAAPPRSWSPIV